MKIIAIKFADFVKEEVEKYTRGQEIVHLRIHSFGKPKCAFINASVLAYVDDDKNKAPLKYGINPYAKKCLIEAGAVVAAPTDQEWSGYAEEGEALTVDDALKVFSGKTAQMIYKSFIRTATPVKLGPAKSNEIISMLMPLFRIRGFPEAWEAYLEDLDECSVLISPQHEGKTYAELFVAATMLAKGDEAIVRTAADLDFMAMMFLICATKNVTTEDQLKVMIKARANGLSHVLGSRTLDEERAKSLLDHQSYLKLSSALSFFPKLKSAIFRHVIVHAPDTPMIMYLKPLLQENQMTVFNLIALFCFSEQKTKAHVLALVVNEMLRYLEAYQKIIDAYGEDYWKYAKLLNSVEQGTATTSYPMLVTAAYYFITATTGGETLKKLTVRHQFSKMIATAVATPIKDDFLSAAQPEITERLKDIDDIHKKRLGLKWAEIEKTSLEQVCGEVNAEMVKDLELAFGPKVTAGGRAK